MATPARPSDPPPCGGDRLPPRISPANAAEGWDPPSVTPSRFLTAPVAQRERPALLFAAKNLLPAQTEKAVRNDEGHFVIGENWKSLLVLGILALVAGCTQSADRLADSVKASSAGTKTYAYTIKDRECLARAMFFESNRSSREGLVAVGTVVMNRLQSGEHGDTVCSVVGEKGQFAPGVLSRPMDSEALPDVQSAAAAVLQGERRPKVQSAMYFHVAGRHFPYKNMHYVLVAGGNAFYEKRSRLPAPQPDAPAEIDTAVASAAPPVVPAKTE